MPGIAQAVVSTYQPAPDVEELAAYYSARRDTPVVDPGRVYAELRERLPAYMVPAYLEQLPAIPVLPSGKADRKSLPAPSGPRHLSTRGDHVAPATGTERALAEVLATVLAADRVSADGHFFNDLGASSLLMAMFSAAVRERGDLPPVSMKDIYLHPTVRLLAAAMGEPGPAREQAPRGPAGGPVPGPLRAPGAPPEAAPAARGVLAYALCGTLQLLAFAAYVAGFSLAVNAGAAWAVAGSGALAVYARLVVFGGGGLLAMGILPVLAKWLLIGRWKPRRIRAWGLAYFRFWLVKTMIVANPLARLFAGHPAVRAVPAGAGRQDRPPRGDLHPARARLRRPADDRRGQRDPQGHLPQRLPRPGRCHRDRCRHHRRWRLRRRARGPRHRHRPRRRRAARPRLRPPHRSGRPGRGVLARLPGRAGRARRRLPDGRAGPLRRPAPGRVQPHAAAARAGRGRPRRGRRHQPAGVTPSTAGRRAQPGGHGGLGRPLSRAGTAGWALPVAVLAVTAAAFLGAILAGLVIAGTVPRLLSRALAPGKVYPLYGIHYALQRAISRLSNVGFFNALFGDSSAIVRYLGLIGYRLAPVEQTGSNFGMEVKHEMPTLAAVGTGTMVSDGLSIINADFSSSSFRVCPAVIGTRNFLGNGIAYPAGGRTGDDCLLATKVMIPVSGPVREGVGLLGSPSFEIPRSVHSDQQFGHLSTNRRRRHRLKAKNRHNAATIGLHLLVRWLYLAGLALIALYAFGGTAVPGASRTGRVGAAVAGALRTAVAAALRTVSGLLRPTGLRTAGLGTTGLGTAMHDALRTTVLGTTVGDALRTAAAILLALAFTVGYFVLVERAVTGFRALKPRFCSIYQPLFWRHERFWKVPSIAYIQMFSGTPFKNVVWRLLGVRVGRRVFDDGCSIVERTLVRIGSEATLNAGSILQGHSLEDGTFKSG